MLKRPLVALTGLLMAVVPALTFMSAAPANATVTACGSVVESGHRAHVYVPSTQTAEETLHAANYGIGHSAAILEMDIWRLGNGRWVVNHDSTWDRTIDGSTSATGAPLSWSTTKTVESTTNAQFNEGPLTVGLNKPAIDLAALMTWAAAHPSTFIWIETKYGSGNLPGTTALNDLVTQEDNNTAGNVGYYGSKTLMDNLQARDVALHPAKGQTGHYGVNFDPGSYNTVNDYPAWAEVIVGPIVDKDGFVAPTGVFNNNALNRAAADGGPMTTFTRGLKSDANYTTARQMNFVILDADDTGDLAGYIANNCVDRVGH